MRNLICCANRPTRPFTTLLLENNTQSVALKYCCNTPISSNLLCVGAGGLITSEPCTNRQPHSICTGSQLNDPQGVARTHLWISLPESNYSFGQTVHPQWSFGPLRLCAGVNVLGGNLSDCLMLRFSLCSSTLEPSSRCVDENWGGSLKSKVSPQLGHHYFFFGTTALTETDLPPLCESVF